MFTVEVRVQECASVTVTVYVPAARLEADAAVPPEGDHTYVYGGVPPLLPGSLRQLLGLSLQLLRLLRYHLCVDRQISWAMDTQIFPVIQRG